MFNRLDHAFKLSTTHNEENGLIGSQLALIFRRYLIEADVTKDQLTAKINHWLDKAFDPDFPLAQYSLEEFTLASKSITDAMLKDSMTLEEFLKIMSVMGHNTITISIPGFEKVVVPSKASPSRSWLGQFLNIFR